MARPLVIAYHLVWTGYGFWLPNDPRGSVSPTIRNDILNDLGSIHFGRKRVHPASRDLRQLFATSAKLLKHSVVEFRSEAVAVIARAFAATVAECKYACAIMPDHVHLLIRKHKHQAEDMIANLQRASHLALREHGLFDEQHPVWGGPGWKVFLDHPDDIRRTIRYVAENPAKQGFPAQPWPFITNHDNWPLRPGRSDSSPYAQRLGALT